MKHRCQKEHVQKVKQVRAGVGEARVCQKQRDRDRIRIGYKYCTGNDKVTGWSVTVPVAQLAAVGEALPLVRWFVPG